MEQRVAEERVHVIPHGIDTSFFHCASDRSSRRSDRVLVVLSVGTYRRNFSLLRDVCCSLVSEPGIRFKIVASRDVAAKFSDLANVECHWGLDDRELLAMYHEAGCFLLTVEEATANNALLEALACGLPIVAEDVGGVREYTGHDCAFLAKRRSSKAIVDALMAMRSSLSERQRMSAAARQKATEFDWRFIARRTTDVYRSLWSAGVAS